MQAVITNIKNFYDIYVFIVMLTIGAFTLISDYRYFKRVKSRADEKSAYILGIAFIILPFVIFGIAKMF